MKTKHILIGNSQWVRIPKPLIEESGLTEEIEMVLRDNEIVLRSAKKIRKDWDQSFEEMAEKGDDQLLDLKRLSERVAGMKLNGHGKSTAVSTI